VGLRFFGADAGQQALAGHVGQCLQREVGIDRARAVADEQGEVMDLAWFARFDYQAHARACALPDQVMVDPGQRQQRRDGRMLAIHAAVRQDEDVGARFYSLIRSCTQRVHRRLQGRDTPDRVGRRGGGKLRRVVVHRFHGWVRAYHQGRPTPRRLGRCGLNPAWRGAGRGDGLRRDTLARG